MTLFQKATKRKAKLRLAIDGPSGSGKTYTALTAARALGGKVAVIDTERGSASLYSDQFDFDVAELNKFNPQAYVDLIEQAESAGYDVIVIDSLSHAWEGEGGALDMADAAKTRTQNQFTAWKDVTPLHRKLVDAMLQSKCHIIATMRSKTEYILEAVEKNGRMTQVPRKVGMAPVQRQGMEYEFTVVCDMDTDHNLSVSKSRCSALADAVANRPTEKFFRVLVDWLNDGGAAPEGKPAFTTPAASEELTLEAAKALEVTDKNGGKHLIGSLDAGSLRKIIANGQDARTKQAAQLVLDNLAVQQ